LFLRDWNEVSVQDGGHDELNRKYNAAKLRKIRIEGNKIGCPAPRYKITLKESTGAGPTKKGQTEGSKMVASKAGVRKGGV
jgi:hypothetical protein